MASSIILLLKKVLITSEKNKHLFSVVENFLEFLVNAPQKYILSSECLVMMRILHNTGFLGVHDEFKTYTSEHLIDIKVLEEINPRNVEMIKIINNSLRTAGMVS
jgi:hypothetical protein